ncbi:LAFA_0G18250g1_1 [Lachancea sp. 'fantastica']|nr:LAFA_0G18250g1_1 [Lachancea sp. 'fantastica']
MSLPFYSFSSLLQLPTTNLLPPPTTHKYKTLPPTHSRLQMLESPVLVPRGPENDSSSSNAASPVQFIKEYIEKTLNTPPGLPVSVATEHYKRQRLIEEIIESEREYVQMLHILQTCFLDVLSINDYIPMQRLSKVVVKILPLHENLCRQLEREVGQSIKRFDESTEPNWSDLSMTSWDHMELCQRFAFLLATEAIETDQYRDYVHYYNQVSHLLTRMGQESQDRLLFAVLFRIELCLPKYYAKTSQQGYKRDFSFRAMIQLPINRITKYRLFLESLVYLTEHPTITDLKRLDESTCAAIAESIQEYLKQMYSTMKRINEPNSNTAKDLTLTLIQNRLSFDSPDERLPIEAMGSCSARGCFAVVWPVTDDSASTSGSYRSRYFNPSYRSKRSLSIESDQFGVFLFDTYLVLAEVPSMQRTPICEWPIKFALRLSNCRLVDVVSEMESQSDDLGLFSNCENSLKIQFDYDFKLWEILIFFRDPAESNAWRKELDECMNRVYTNGEELQRLSRQESVTQSTLESTLHFSDTTTFPEQMVPYISYNETLSGRFDRAKTAKTVKSGAANCAGFCYRGEMASVEVEFRDSLLELSPASTWFTRGSSSRLDLRPETGCSLREPSNFRAVFTRWKRVQIERSMWDVWSPQLQKLCVVDDKREESSSSELERAFVRAASDNLIATQASTVPVRSSSTFRTTRWSIRRVFSRRRSRRKKPTTSVVHVS